MNVGSTTRVTPTLPNRNRSEQIRVRVDRYEHYAAPRSVALGRKGIKLFAPLSVIPLALMPVGGTAALYSIFELFGIHMEKAGQRKANKGFRSRLSLTMRTVAAASTLAALTLSIAYKTSAFFHTPFFGTITGVLIPLGIGLYIADKIVRTVQAWSSAKKLAALVQSEEDKEVLREKLHNLPEKMQVKLTGQLASRGVVI